ncbi:hypothetical protein U9R90_27010 [Streptomyces sp. E11-3]|uniref:hypothetical protein n=1 Tax=Streptomyces sp. E11-3 TaxID=3110112 RepID=UPI00398045DC
MSAHRHPDDVILCRLCKVPQDEHRDASHRFAMYVSPPRNWRISVSWERQIGSGAYRFDLIPARNRPSKNGGELIVTRTGKHAAAKVVHRFRVRSTVDYRALLAQTGQVRDH